MAGELNLKRGDAFYNDFYSRGGWRYSFLREYRWHRWHLVKKFGVRRGARALEIACGSGFHTNLLCRMGLDCAGVDRSAEGIRWAKEHYPKRAFHCCDFRAMPFERESFDLILARGFSFYHYDLQSNDAINATEAILPYIKPGGVFVMMILTDLSGRREEGKVWHNTIGDYERHFALFGRKSLVDWADGMAICGLWNDRKAAPSDGSSPLRELDTDSNTCTSSCGNTSTDTHRYPHRYPHRSWQRCNTGGQVANGAAGVCCLLRNGYARMWRGHLAGENTGWKPVPHSFNGRLVSAGSS